MKQKIRKHKSRTEKVTKKEKNSNNDKNQYGMTHDQMIDLSHVHIQREILLHKLNEHDTNQLKIEFDCITREIETAERRAERRCPIYQEYNRYWMEVDQLLEERTDLRRRMSSSNTKKRNFSIPYDEIIVSPQSTTTRFIDKPCLDSVFGVKTLDKQFNANNLSSEVIEVKGNTFDNDNTKQKDSVLVTRV